MTDTNSPLPSSVRPGLIARHKRALTAGVFGLAALGVVAAGGLAFNPTSPARAENPIVMTQPGSFADVIEKVKPAVVSVKVKTQDQRPRAEGRSGGSDLFPGLPPDHPMQRWFRQFGFNAPDGAPQPRGRQGMSQGSGFFITADGYVVTNNHVVDDATEVDVVTDDGKTYTAKVIGTDPKTDLALLKVQDGGSFPHVSLAASAPRVGDWVLAVGNPFGLGGTVTAGIVSARGRDIGAGPYDDFLQIDAAVNKGNSGGPTFDLKGNVIGVNTAIFSPSGGNVGIAFAIPAETVEKVVAQLKSDGAVTRGWIGVQIQPVSPEIADSLGLKKAEGAIVADVTDGGPASDAGIKSGDTILAVNGEAIAGPRELARAIAAIKPGTSTTLTVWRNGEEEKITVDLGSLPSDMKKAEAAPGQKDGADEQTSLATLGLKLAPASRVLDSGAKGVAVIDVDPASSAAERFREGDVIVDIGGKPVNTIADVRGALEKSRADGRRSVLMRVVNGEDMRFVALPLGKA